MTEFYPPSSLSSGLALRFEALFDKAPRIMSDRLTATERKYPRWVSWVPWGLLAVSLLGLLVGERPGWDLPESPSGYARLQSIAIQSLGAEHAAWMLLPFFVLLLTACGSLSRRLLPAKTPLPAARLAQSLGIVCVAAPLMLRSQAAWSAHPALPAAALLFSGWAVFLQAMERPQRYLAALGGLLLGLAAGFDPIAAPGILPPLVWAALQLRRNQTPSPLPRTVILVVGIGVGLLLTRPQLPAVSASFDWAHLQAALHDTRTRFGIAGLALMFLALLVGTLQKNTVLLGLLLATYLLQKAALGLFSAPTPPQLTALALIPALLLAYGLFRILRGIESGVHSVQPDRAKWVAPALLLLLLIAFKVWTLFHYQTL